MLQSRLTDSDRGIRLSICHQPPCTSRHAIGYDEKMRPEKGAPVVALLALPQPSP